MKFRRLAELSYKQWIGIGAIVLVLLVGLRACNVHVLRPIIDKTTLHQELSFKKAQEDRISDSIGILLKQLVGKNSYYVSVNTILRSRSEEEFGVRFNPNPVTENYKHELNGKWDYQDKDTHMTEGQRSKQEESDPKLLPGLVPGADSPSQALPGFPQVLVQTPGGQSNSADQERVTTTNQYEGLRNISLTRNGEEQTVFFNQNHYRRTTPRLSIDRLIVSVVVDKARFEKEGIAPAELERLVRHIAGIEPQRGDELYISYLQLSNSLLDWYIIGKGLHKLKLFFVKYRIFFLTVIGIVLTLVFGYLSYVITKKVLHKRREQLLAAEKARLEAEQKAKEASVKEKSEKRDQIVQLARSKPHDLGQLIINWLDDIQDEEASDE